MARKDPRLNTAPENFNEQLQDRIIRHMVYMEGLKTRQARDIDEFIVKEVIPDLQDQLAARIARIQELGFDGSPATTARIETQLKALESISKKFNKDISEMVQGELFDIASDEVKWTVGMINTEANPVNIEFVLPAAERLRAAVINNPFDGKLLKDWFDELEVNTQRRLSSEVRRGIVQGRTIEQHVRAIVGTKSNNYADGIINKSRRDATTIVRTAVSHSQRVAQEALWNENESLIKGEKWVSTLDSRTCPRCQSLDGKVWPLNEGTKPPLHMACRCMRVPILKSWKELGINGKEPKFEKFRASADGRVPRDVTYNQWLKNQSLETQEIALGGKAKAKLFRDGGLQVNDFVSRDLQVKTLEDISKLEKDAFNKANL